MLDRIRQEASVSYRTFSGSAELGRLVRDDLAVLLSERFTVSSAARAAPGRVRGPRSLPVGSTSLVGREEAIGEVAALVTNPEVRLVTLTGPGGVGKTRLALATGERLRHHFNGSTAFVPLAAVTDPEQVLAGIARAVGADPAGTSSASQALAEQFWIQLYAACGAGGRRPRARARDYRCAAHRDRDELRTGAALRDRGRARDRGTGRRRGVRRGRAARRTYRHRPPLVPRPTGASPPAECLHYGLEAPPLRTNDEPDPVWLQVTAM